MLRFHGLAGKRESCSFAPNTGPAGAAGDTGAVEGSGPGDEAAMAVLRPALRIMQKVPMKVTCHL